MQVTVEQLLLIVGELEVKRRMLEAQIQQLEKESDDNSGDAD